MLLDLPETEDERSVLKFVCRQTIATGAGYVEARLLDPADGPSITRKLAREHEPGKLGNVALDVLLG